MKKNTTYIFIILIFLICEIFAQSVEVKIYHASWTVSFRVLSFITMGIWYFQMQKEHFDRMQKVFLISILLPILPALMLYLFIEKIAVGVNICIHFAIFFIWIDVFKRMGAAIKVFNSSDNSKFFLPFIFIILFVYFIMVLYPNVSFAYAFIIFIFIILASYAGMLVLFLPSNDNNKYLIILGVCLSIFAHIMHSYYIFLLESYLIYPFFRAMIVLSACSMIFGMINLNNNPSALNDED